MSAFYVDTSALLKRYVTEIGSAWIANTLSPASGNVILISKLTLVEMYSAFARQRREGRLSAANVLQLQQQVLVHSTNEYVIKSVDDGILNHAQVLVDQHTIRSLDAIQLACALLAAKTLASPVTFLSADPKLLGAAAIEGFAIDNPLNHP